jgi:hypothetical protein
VRRSRNVILLTAWTIPRRTRCQARCSIHTALRASQGAASLADVVAGDTGIVKLRRRATAAAAGTPLAARALFDRTHPPARAAFKR